MGREHSRKMVNDIQVQNGTLWADKAYQLHGGGQSAYDFIMSQPLCERHASYMVMQHGLPLSANQMDQLNRGTYWAGQAYQIGGQSAYDTVMKMPVCDRHSGYTMYAN